MRKRHLCILICLFANALFFANAANRTITGIVISGEDNEPLIGASVYVSADELKKAGVPQTSLGTITDIDGKFSLSVPEKVTRIHCSYIGFEEQSVPYCTSSLITYIRGRSSNWLSRVGTPQTDRLHCQSRCYRCNGRCRKKYRPGISRTNSRCIRYDNLRCSGCPRTYPYSWYSVVKRNARPAVGVGRNSIGRDGYSGLRQ